MLKHEFTRGINSQNKSFHFEIIVFQMIGIIKLKKGLTYLISKLLINRREKDKEMKGARRLCLVVKAPSLAAQPVDQAGHSSLPWTAGQITRERTPTPPPGPFLALLPTLYHTSKVTASSLLTVRPKTGGTPSCVSIFYFSFYWLFALSLLDLLTSRTC